MLKKIGNKKKQRLASGGSEKSLFFSIFQKRKKTDLTGKVFTKNEVKCWQFAHILAKGMYPEYRLNENNIIFVDDIKQHERVDKQVAGNKRLFEKMILEKTAINYLRQKYKSDNFFSLKKT